MDDSDQDFDISAKLLRKRVRRKAECPPALLSRKAESPSDDCDPNAAADPGKKKRKKKHLNSSESPSPPRADWASTTTTTRRPEPHTVVVGENARDGGPPGPTGPDEAATDTVVDDEDGGQRARKDQVLWRMQQFKRVAPQSLVHHGGTVLRSPTTTKDMPQPEPGPSDAALAFRLQQDLDKEAAEAFEIDNLEDRGLFFCQLCQRDLSHMTPEGRAQHLNRCLDETEHIQPVVPLSPPRVADCPICGKSFKFQKSRKAHLKRCSADMGVAPALLLQCLQRQANEAPGYSGSCPRVPARGSKRKEPAEPSLPVKKKLRKKAQPLDEDTMLAMALSSSLLEREKELKRDAADSLASTAPRPQWRPEAGKGRRKAGKRRKQGPPRPPPLLLVQDRQAALTRHQERVAALMQQQHAPSPPPTPTFPPSRLDSAGGSSYPLWIWSQLEHREPCNPAQFYIPELRDLLMPREPPEMTTTSASKENPDSSIHPPASADTQMTPAGSATLHPPAPSQTSPLPSTSCAGTGRPPLSSQEALRDLMELAEEGRTLSQWLRDDAGSTAIASDLRFSGFVPEEREEHGSESSSERSWHEAVLPSSPVVLSRLSSDLSSMVNNPQLSDVQIQVDSGEVYFVHSFMLYSRCPLLAQMVHDSGFGVQEEGLPIAQRVLLGEIPGEAVLALLQYLYAGRCPAPSASLLELATRFDLVELQRLCQLYQEETDAGLQENTADEGQPWNNNSRPAGEEPASGDQEEPACRDQDFMQLLQSVWSEEEDGECEEEEGTPGTLEDAVDRQKVGRGGGGSLASGDELRVNDEEMEEIYEFAATQRKLAEERDSTEDDEDAGTHEEDEDAGTHEEPISSEDDLVAKAASPPEETLVGLKEDIPEEHVNDEEMEEIYEFAATQKKLAEERDSTEQEEEDAGTPEEDYETHEEEEPITAEDDLFAKAGSPQHEETSVEWSSGGQAPSSLFSGSWGIRQEFPASPQPTSPQHTRPHRNSPGRASPRAERRAWRSDRICLQSSSCNIIDLTADRDEGAVNVEGRPSQPPATDMWKCPKRESQSPLSICQPASPALASPVPSPPLSPVLTQSHQQYRQIKPPPRRPSTSPTARGTEERGCDGLQGSACDPDQMGFSPEVSWLVPGTPLQASPSTSSICTQTQSSMCRKWLSPKALLGAFSSTTPQTSESHPPTDAPAESSVPVPLSPPAQYTQPGPPAFNLPPRFSSSSEKTPTHGHPPSYSSTPLHTKHGRVLHLSRSDVSDSPSPRCEDRSSPSDLIIVDSEKTREGVVAMAKGEERRMESEGEHEQVSEPGFCQSFMDDPPMAFNDSWGLDAGGGSEEEGGQALPTSTHSLHSPLTQREQNPSTSTLPTNPNPLADPDTPPRGPEVNCSPLDPQLWDSWEEDQCERRDEALPLLQRVNPVAQFQTPVSSESRKRTALVPVTPMPSYSDMATPELKNKLNSFGVRPLPKRQMILKLKEIHQYTHQLVQSDEEEEEVAAAEAEEEETEEEETETEEEKTEEEDDGVGDAPSTSSAWAQETGPQPGREDTEPLSSTQGSSTSSTITSEESQQSHTQLLHSSGSESDGEGCVTASQAASRHHDRVQAVEAFILSNTHLYNQVLQYQPLVLSELQASLKAAGIRLSTTKLMDYLDSQCITVTTAKPRPRAAKGRRRGKAKGAVKPTRAEGERGARGRKKKTPLAQSESKKK